MAWCMCSICAAGRSSEVPSSLLAGGRIERGQEQSDRPGVERQFAHVPFLNTDQPWGVLGPTRTLSNP
eukprot:15456827-Alexandrium_andersonii.AAC.1